MKKVSTLIFIVSILFGILSASLFLIISNQEKVDEKLKLHEDVQPLFSGVEWQEPVTQERYGMSGVEVVSNTLSNVVNIAELTIPFETYYRNLLLGRGWEEDIMMAAGGPGGAIIAYTKNGSYIVFSYESEFLIQNANEPGQCPCNIKFSIFTSTQGVQSSQDQVTVDSQYITDKENNVTERYEAVIDRVHVVLEHFDFVSYRLSTNDLVREGELNTERGYKDDVDATVFVLNWREPEGNQMRYVKLTSDPGKLYLLDTEQNIISGSALVLVP